MDNLIVTDLLPDSPAVEIVERKGLGHPDTICDALAESVSRTLCREYRQRFGTILHHNVDKALLTAGRSAPAFGGGRVLAPISICLSGRAAGLGGDAPAAKEVAVETARDWLRANLHALDATSVQFHWLVRPVSEDLQALFGRRAGGIPIANDTSIGVGYAPLSRLERLVLAIEHDINHRDRNKIRPAWGEDVKVMATRRGDSAEVTIACAVIDRYVASVEAYLDEKQALQSRVSAIAAEFGFTRCDVAVNAADDIREESLFLTVTGTSAENGDDGEVGRGNRINGLITPNRPMSLEAAAGKNPVTHVGKIYNVVARIIAETLVANVPGIAAAQCFLTSRIGRALTNPAITHVRLTTLDGAPATAFGKAVAETAAEILARIPALVDEFVAGNVQIF